MKKIFTFVFFAGLMTSAMAQNGRNTQYRNQNNNQSAAAVNNGQSNGGYNQQPAQGNNGYNQNNNYPQNNSYQQNEQGYSHNNEGGYENDRRSDDRNDDRRFRGHERFDQRAYGYERRREFERFNRGRFNARLSIRFRQPACY